MIDVTFSAPLWLWQGKASWHFVTVPEEPSAVIRSFAPDAKRGFGSVRVQVRIGETWWQTSVFPDRESGCYLLPIKKSVRAAEGLEAGTQADISLEILM